MNETTNQNTTIENVKEYYGKILESSKDLQTDACCTSAGMPDFIKSAQAKVHTDVLNKYYGCGLVAPELLESTRVLDLGSGSGLDAYVLAQLVGEKGKVVGVDMTDEQLETANKYVDYHKEAFGYKETNVEFKKGYIEKLDELGLEDESFDVIVSNCVINLSPDKNAVFKESARILKQGGELYFSDVYCDRRVPKVLVENELLYGECLSGALYWNDFLQIAKSNGFIDPRLVTHRELKIDNPEVQKLLDGYKFYSATYRLFKIPELEPDCEDFGQAVIYKGTVPHHPTQLDLDVHHSIRKGQAYKVCGNTYRMLNQSRFKNHFDFLGSWDEHFGIFEGCGGSFPFKSEGTNSSVAQSGACC